MKILYLHQYFALPDSCGGTRSYEMARRLVLAGHDVTMVTTSAFLADNYNKKGWNRFVFDGININSFHLPYSNATPFWRRILIFLTFVVRASLQVFKGQYDVVFATSTPLTIAIPGMVAATWHKIPFVFEVRDLWPEIPIALGVLKNSFIIGLARWLEKKAYFSADKVIALSPGMAEGVIALGVSPEKVFVIPNASNIDASILDDDITAFREQYVWLQDRPLIVYTGTIGYVNGLSYLVDFAYEVLKSNVEIRIVVIGDGIEKESIVQYATRKDVLGVNFFLLPPVPRKDIPTILAAADFAVSTVRPIKELWNNSANKFFDALASGTPVAINHFGWQAELLKKTGAGLVLDPQSPEKAASLMTRLLADSKWMHEASEAAYGLAENRFNINKLAVDFENVLIRACESNLK